MEEIIPSLPDSHLVRTYSKDYAGTDTESEGDVQFEVDSADGDEDISTRLQQNQEYMDNQITQSSGEHSSWILERQSWTTNEGTNVVLIKKPTASKFSHRHPFIYRNIQKVGTLDELAALLDTPHYWKTKYTQVVKDGFMIRKLQRFSDLPEETSEADIQTQFIGLVEAMASRLGIELDSRSETKIIVGGILARYQYDHRSKTDPHFLDTDGVHLIATEVKTHRTFAPGEMWYHGSRGIQVLSALYAYNSPTFLFTQKQWKLFVENKERNAVLTYPFDDDVNHTPHVNSSLINPMVMETPEKTIIKEKYFDTTRKPQRQLARLQKASESYDGQKQPSFVSGYIDGQPVYTAVRVLPQEVVSRIEDEIALQEKMKFQPKASETTLFE